MEKSTNILPLSKVSEGKKVLVKDIKNDVVKNNLSRVGIFIDNELFITKKGWGNSPIALQKDDLEIAIRKDIADLIEVEILNLSNE